MILKIERQYKHLIFLKVGLAMPQEVSVFKQIGLCHKGFSESNFGYIRGGGLVAEIYEYIDIFNMHFHLYLHQYRLRYVMLRNGKYLFITDINNICNMSTIHYCLQKGFDLALSKFSVTPQRVTLFRNCIT